MEGINIQTTQHVALAYQQAGVGLRILAALIDRFIFYAYVILVIYVFTNFLMLHNYSNGDYERVKNYDSVIYAIMILLLLPAMLYHLLCETFLNGQSFGKKLVKIKVVKLDGTQPNFGSYLIRSMFRLIDVTVFSPAVAIIAIAASEKGQRLGDMAAGTTVIRLDSKITIKDTILYQQQEDYKIVYEQVSVLNDKEANVIKQVLEFSVKENKPEHIKRLAEKIKDKLGILSTNQEDIDFLNTILKDYSHYRFDN